MNVDSIAMMPCNPHIGGSSKGHLVREIDALGGEMGKNIDKTFIQSKMLNISKGPAVHSLRTQADKAEYSKAMRKILENQENLTIRQVEVTDILTQYDLEKFRGKISPITVQHVIVLQVIIQQVMVHHVIVLKIIILQMKILQMISMLIISL